MYFFMSYNMLSQSSSLDVPKCRNLKKIKASTKFNQQVLVRLVRIGHSFRALEINLFLDSIKILSITSNMAIFHTNTSQNPNYFIGNKMFQYFKEEKFCDVIFKVEKDKRR